MAKKRLDKVTLGRLRAAILKGGTAKDIAAQLGISVPSVNVYKRKLRDEGLSVPSKRGRKPKGKTASASKPVKKTKAAKGKSGYHPVAKKTGPARKQPADFNRTFVVNGTVVGIEGKPKNIQVGKHRIVIDY
jgi:transposase